MKQVVLGSFLALFGNVAVAQSIIGTAQFLPDSPYVPPGYVLTFNDEFASLNTISSGPGPYVKGVLWYNGNVQGDIQPSVAGQSGQMYPTPGPGGVPINPFSLDPAGGLDLSLTLSGNMWNSGQPDSMANDGVGFAQQYGYFEMSAQLPADPGTWPGFWMRPVNPRANNGEIDILEAYTQFQSTYCMTLHDWNNGGAGPQACGGLRPTAGTVPGGGVTPGLPGGHTVSDGYHVYAMLWTPTLVSFYCDGALMWSVPPLHPAMDGPFFLIFDLGIGGGWPTTGTTSPSVMKIKYIRAYRAQ
jgi:Glycosyl hydrolases family 16